MKKPGRPAIGKFTAVRFPPEMLERIDALAGVGKRSAFIRAAANLVMTSIEDLEARHLPSGEVELVKGSVTVQDDVRRGVVRNASSEGA